jgi:hypothetical protein
MISTNSAAPAIGRGGCAKNADRLAIDGLASSVKGIPRRPDAMAERSASAALMQPSIRENAMHQSNITPGHVRAFQAVTTQL